jgi:hypothetical protein
MEERVIQAKFTIFGLLKKHGSAHGGARRTRKKKNFSFKYSTHKKWYQKRSNSDFFPPFFWRVVQAQREATET